MADPIKILEVVKKADDLVRACQEVLAIETVTDATLPDARTVGTHLLAAVDVLRALDPLHDRGKDHEKADKPDKAAKAVNDLKKLISLEAPKVEQPSELRELFSNISNSLINAQKELNRTSLDYVASLDPRLPPTLYGIPNVKAEMRVGFNKIEGKGINLFLFTNTSQKQQFAESVVSFEIAGTTPPPGPAVYGDYVVPIPRLLVVGQTRERLLDQIIAEKKVAGAPYLNTRDKVLVLRYERDQTIAFNRYLVLWVSQRANQSGTQWHGVTVIYAIGRPVDGGEQETFEFPNTDKDNTIFEFPPANNALVIPPNKLEELGAHIPEFAAGDKPEMKLAKLSIDLGDVIMNLNEIVNGWLDSVRYKPAQ